MIELAAGNPIKAGAAITATLTMENGTSYFYRISYKNLSAEKMLNQIDKIDSLDILYRFCQEKLLNLRGRDLNKLAETLQELIYRYNNRDIDLFELLMNKLIKKE
jgi:hypothetical protein